MKFTSFKIGNLNLKNRIIRSGCFEGMCPDGKVTDQLIEHHRLVAAGGSAMTTVAYCSVSFDGRAYEHEMWMREEILPNLKRLTDAVHKEGASASIQLGHCGFFASPGVIGKKPLGASEKFCTFRLSRCREMTDADIHEKISDFVKAALMAVSAGFDAIEIHSGHGYLMSQFLSPWTNKRKDSYGGSLVNRMRFPLMIIKSVREALGADFPIIVKINQLDGFKNGLQLEDAIEVAKNYEAAGASALVPSCGFTARTPLYMMRGLVPFKEMAANQKKFIIKMGLILFGRFMVQKYDFNPLYLLEGAIKIKNAVNIPVIYIGGVLTSEHIESVLKKGFSFVQIGRALIEDPNLVSKMKFDKIINSQCDHCNRCIAAMDGGGVFCVSREIGYLE